MEYLRGEGEPLEDDLPDYKLRNRNIWRHRQSGMKYREIADRYDIGTPRVWQILKSEERRIERWRELQKNRPSEARWRFNGRQWTWRRDRC